MSINSRNMYSRFLLCVSSLLIVIALTKTGHTYLLLTQAPFHLINANSIEPNSIEPRGKLMMGLANSPLSDDTTLTTLATVNTRNITNTKPLSLLLAYSSSFRLAYSPFIPIPKDKNIGFECIESGSISTKTPLTTYYNPEDNNLLSGIQDFVTKPEDNSFKSRLSNPGASVANVAPPDIRSYIPQ